MQELLKVYMQSDPCNDILKVITEILLKKILIVGLGMYGGYCYCEVNNNFQILILTYYYFNKKNHLRKEHTNHVTTMFKRCNLFLRNTY